ncbi:hypothetical protein HDU98_011234 [Podochytrium sp. JEL0797]|nr:hypothetical protein HDU98_011234 [Podochytrium sp. JEL0797]
MQPHAKRVPTYHPRASCPACQRRLGKTQNETAKGNGLHPKEWQSYGLVEERKSNKPGFAFTAFEAWCPLHVASKDKGASLPLTPSRAIASPPSGDSRIPSLSRSNSVAAFQSRSPGTSATPKNRTMLPIPMRSPTANARKDASDFESGRERENNPSSDSPLIASALSDSPDPSLAATTSSSTDSPPASTSRFRGLSAFIPAPRASISESPVSNLIRGDTESGVTESTEQFDFIESEELPESIQDVQEPFSASESVMIPLQTPTIDPEPSTVEHQERLDSPITNATEQTTSPPQEYPPSTPEDPSFPHEDDFSLTIPRNPTAFSTNDTHSVLSYDFHLDSETLVSTSRPPSPTPTLSRTSSTRRRKPIDMTNLTLLHHLLTTRLSDLQTHHAALYRRATNTLPPTLQTHHTQTYIKTAKEIIFLGRGIARSWAPIARSSPNKSLARDLVLSLERIDTLSARMKGVLGSVVVFRQGADEEGVVLSSAVEVVKAAEEALLGLEAVRVVVYEKEEEEAEGEGGKGGEEGGVEIGVGGEGQNVEFSGMEGMEEALKIAMQASNAVG